MPSSDDSESKPNGDVKAEPSHVSLVQVFDDDFHAIRRVIEDSDVAQGMTVRQIDDLTLHLHSALDGAHRDEIEQLNQTVGELSDGWERALEHTKKPPRYLLEACPRWLRIQLGHGEAA